MLSDERANGHLSSVGLALAGLLVLSGLLGGAWGQNDPAKVQVKGESSPPSAARTAVLVTHNLGEAAKLSHRIAVILGGVLRQVGTADEIKSNPADVAVAAFLHELPQ